MSRIGKVPVPVPAGVKIAVADRTVGVEGPKGKLEQSFHPMVAIQFDEPGKRIVVTRQGETRQHKAMHGLVRALVRNMIEGVTQGLREEAGDCRRRLSRRRAKERASACALASPTSCKFPFRRT